MKDFSISHIFIDLFLVYFDTVVDGKYNIFKKTSNKSTNYVYITDIHSLQLVSRVWTVLALIVTMTFEVGVYSCVLRSINNTIMIIIIVIMKIITAQTTISLTCSLMYITERFLWIGK